jgi:very-short-patch-repair endonuclease
MPSKDLDILRHQEWLGLLQPVGLVVSPPALIKAQAVIDRAKLVALQERLQGVVSPEAIPRHGDEGMAWIENFPAFTQKVLDWMPEDLVAADDLPDRLSAVLPSYGETLRPTYGVKDPDSGEWVLLIQELAPGLALDEDDPAAATGQGWKASFQAKFERLLRETGIPTGLLVNGTEMRLVYAPSGESSGYLTFPVQAMVEVPGRLILGALDLLIGADRLFNVPENQRLNRLLVESRNYQAEVSTKLASQVLDALWELLRGFQSADAAANGKIFAPLLSPLSLDGRGAGGEGVSPAVAPSSPNPFSHEGRRGTEAGGQHIYGGLIATLMRLVFLLYAEDEGLMPDDEVYQRHYAVSGLYEKLREDAGSYPDTMDQRYGAWATLLSLFRLVYDGGGAYDEYLPARHGQLFDPDEYPFLEGRTSPPSPLSTCEEGGQEKGLEGEAPHGSESPSPDGRGVGVRVAGVGVRTTVPRIADGVIYRMLDKLLMLEGERLSYRALDVEQIGSVYEAIMGYEVEVAEGLSIGVKPKDVVINVEALLAEKPGNRAKVLQDWAECKLTGKGATALKAAKTIDDILAALGSRVSSRTPNLVPPGGLYLQPGEERRRTGSHYTPRKLTQPIVETTLRPIFEQLGDHPTPEQILELKVCDLAMGSAAFLVEACRQLAEKLVEAWDYHGNFAAHLPGVDPHPPTPSPQNTLTPGPIKGEGSTEALLSPSPLVGEGLGMRGPEGEPDRWEVPDAVRQKMVEVARQFRKEPTQSEDVLWQALRGRKLEGYKFRRQQPIGSFVVDFFCPAAKLIVEVDGGIHESQRELDKARQELLESLGLWFVRLPSNLVENDLPTALNTIKESLALIPGPHPPAPSPRTGEGGPEALLSPYPPVEDANTLTPSSFPMQEEGDRTLAPFSPGGRRAGDEGEQPRQIISDIEPLLLARRLVAQRCLYGVDKNPFAVNLAKLSLWLVTLAKDQPFTFVDHALKCGDSLVGLTRAEIGSFGKDPTEDLPLFKYLKEKVDRAKAYRTQIQALDTRTDADAEEKLAQWQRAERELEEAKLIGDVKIAAFFDGKSKKEREAKLSEYGDLVRTWRQENPPLPLPPSPTGGEGEPERTLAPLSLDGRGVGGEGDCGRGVGGEGDCGRGVGVRAISDSLRNAEKPITPFNWEIEFPEVFDRENPGFDAIVGNPPFAGKNTTINSNPEGYVDWLKVVHPEAHGNADLVAHFFRRAFTIIRHGGAFGLIATNTIAQGDTRSTGLRYICHHGGIIYNATRRYRWPGVAAVVVSLVHIWKGTYKEQA